MKIVIALVLSAWALISTNSLARAEEPVEVECWFLDESQDDWSEFTSRLHGMDTLVSNCEGQGGIAWINLMEEE